MLTPLQKEILRRQAYNLNLLALDLGRLVGMRSDLAKPILERCSTQASIAASQLQDVVCPAGVRKANGRRRKIEMVA